MSLPVLKRPLRPLAGPNEVLMTLYLFGKSDIPVATLPTIAIALVLAGPSSLPLLVKGLLWNQLHLLTFQVKNQVSVTLLFAIYHIRTHSNDEINGLEEDRIAKPHRPLPSGRISLENAQILYYCLFLSMWIAAIYTKTILCTLVYSVAIVIYNEGGLAAIPVLKNIIGASGLACYCWGTTVIFDHGKELHGMKAIAVLMIGVIFATTGHAQDFRDRSADALMGRKTIPLLLSQPLARWSLAVLIMAWTTGLIALWQPPVVASVVFAALGLRTICGYLGSYDEKDDYTSYIFYGFWLLGSNLLPIFSRMRGEMQ